MEYPIQDLGNVQRREIEGGWVQFREKRADGSFGRWKFHIHGFDDTVSGQDGFCHVMRADDVYNRTPIDTRDRILINGQRYGRDQ